MSYSTTPWNVAWQASLYFTVSWSLVKLMSIDFVKPSNDLILCCPHLFLQSFPGSFLMDWHFASGSQSIRVSASASVLPMSIQDRFPSGLTGLISLQSTGLSSLLQHHNSKASILWHSAFFYGPILTSIHDYWKRHSFDYTDLCQQSNVSAF